jgi:hypothetical protein
MLRLRSALAQRASTAKKQRQIDEDDKNFAIRCQAAAPTRSQDQSRLVKVDPMKKFRFESRQWFGSLLLEVPGGEHSRHVSGGRGRPRSGWPVKVGQGWSRLVKVEEKEEFET